MPFGLKNAAQTFQRLMDKVFRQLHFLFTYLDDHLIASRTPEEHHDHLRQFFELLAANGLQINPEKCVFAATAVDFLGHRVSAEGVAPLPKHVEALAQLSVPTDVKELQRFHGLVNFYRRFLPGIAGVLKPLTNALRGNPKKLVVTEAMQQAVQVAKSALASATHLAHPAPAAVLSLATDASDHHIGAVLQQLEGRHWRLLAFFSQKLNATQQKYSTFDRELTAIFAALRHFCFILEGRSFHILTDHKPLVAAFWRVSPPWSARQQWKLAYIAEFCTNIWHTPSASNYVADALSRPAAPLPPSLLPAAPESSPSSSPLVDPPLPLPIFPSSPSVDDWPAPSPTQLCPVLPPPQLDLAAFSAAQKTCPDVQLMRQSQSLDIVYRLCGDVYLYGDISTPVFRPLVPRDFCRPVFEMLHNAGHPGRRATKRLVASSYVWPKLAQTVTGWARECLHCQRAKVHRHTHPPPTAIPVPAHWFYHVNIDIVGPMPYSGDYTHLLTVIDRCSHWPGFPLTATSAADCAKAFFAGWVCRFGIPSCFTSDRGPQFTSSVWSSLCSLLSINHTLTPAYHPQANGIVEQVHRHLKDGLRARQASNDWFQRLPWILLSKDDSSPAPAELLYGSQLVLPGQMPSWRLSRLLLMLVFLPPLTITFCPPPLRPLCCHRTSSMRAWSLFAATKQNRRWPLLMLALTAFWSGPRLSSGSRLVRRRMWWPPTASSRHSCRRRRSPLRRRAVAALQRTGRLRQLLLSAQWPLQLNFVALATLCGSGSPPCLRRCRRRPVLPTYVGHQTVFSLPSTLARLGGKCNNPYFFVYTDDA
jgi:RNase H-like domain found in reverse transcriptase/Reverse transcriptase (RNA-dependent DNA polymerase)/Integrase zinc binding domain/Integrase core domain